MTVHRFKVLYLLPKPAYHKPPPIFLIPMSLIAVLRRNLTEALRHGDLANAESLLARLQEEEPVSVETRGLTLEYLLRAMRLGEAQVLAQQLLALYPASARIYSLAGQVAYRSKDYARAIYCLRESERLHSHPATRRDLGRALTQVGEFDSAEPLLREALSRYPRTALDLAWLHERRGDIEPALRAIESFLAQHPDDAWASAQARRLRAKRLAPDELQEEVDNLLAVGETLSDDVLPEYFDQLLASGQSARARSFIGPRIAGLAPTVAVRLGWVAYRHHAYDLVMMLFLSGFSEHCGQFKYLNALESAAAKCARLPDLITLYEQRAAEHRPLYGRLKTLRRRLQGQPGQV